MLDTGVKEGLCAGAITNSTRPVEVVLILFIEKLLDHLLFLVN